MTTGLRVKYGTATTLTDYTQGGNITTASYWHAMATGFRVQRDILNGHNVATVPLKVAGAAIDVPPDLSATSIEINDVPIFTGMVSDVPDAHATPDGAIIYPIHSVDWRRWANQHPIDATFAAQPADAIINWVAANVLNTPVAGLFTTNNVSTSPTITVQDFVAKSWSFNQLMTYIAKPPAYAWDIRYDAGSGSPRDIHWFPPSSGPASPLPSNTLNAEDPTPLGTDAVGNIKVHRTATQFRSLVVTSANTISTNDPTAIALAAAITGTDGVFFSLLPTIRKGGNQAVITAQDEAAQLLQYGRNQNVSGDPSCYIVQFTHTTDAIWDVGMQFTFTTNRWFCGPSRATLTLPMHVTGTALRLVYYPQSTVPILQWTITACDRPTPY